MKLQAMMPGDKVICFECGKEPEDGDPEGAQAIGSHEHSQEEEVSDNQQRVVDAQSWTGFT